MMHPATRENPAPTKPNLNTHVINLVRQHQPTTPHSLPNTNGIHSTESKLPTNHPRTRLVQPATKNKLLAQPEHASSPVHHATMSNTNINILHRIMEARREKHVMAKVKMDERIMVHETRINSDI